MKEENATVSLTHAGGNKCVRVIFNLQACCHFQGCFPEKCGKAPPADRPSPEAESEANGLGFCE